jgi:NADP-dependent aldehyde dehydrogenase
MATVEPVLINGTWRAADHRETFQAYNPCMGEPLGTRYPKSTWSDCQQALDAACEAAIQLRRLPRTRIADFLEAFAQRIDAQVDALAEMAHQETALPVAPRLRDVEGPRTSGQLRQAAQAARTGSWALPTIDTQANIRACYRAIGPVCVFGPNNFPLAFNSVSGGDFAAAIAAGNPVIAKANSSHPGTTRLLAILAHEAQLETELPSATVQMLYRLDHADGQRLVADGRVAATGYTGSRSAGLKLKAAADAAGKPIYLELSSVNPVVILPGALQERAGALAEEFASSCLMGTGQFCTNPGLVLLLEGEATGEFINAVGKRFETQAVGTLLSSGVQRSLERSVQGLEAAGAECVVAGAADLGVGYCHPNTLLRVEGARFLEAAESFQAEAFGNAALMVVVSDVQQLTAVLDTLEGNLTGCVYSDTSGKDDSLYETIEPHLRCRVGRLLNDKMPTGVAVSPAMNHGGPYPATGHPGFTAVGIPASMIRFAMLQCYDNVRPDRLPELLRDKNPTGQTWRSIDGTWTQADVGPS